MVSMMLDKIRDRIYNHDSITGKALEILPSYKFLQKSQWWSREQLEEYQLEQLSKLLHHAYENVPYYRRIFYKRGLEPKDIGIPLEFYHENGVSDAKE